MTSKLSSFFYLATLVIFAVVSGEYVDYLSDAYIEKLNSEGLSWKAGRNFPSNLTEEDITRLFGKKPNGIPEKPLKRYSPSYSHLSSIPTEYDARTIFKPCAEIVGFVPDQGACASAYAFALPSVASDRLCIASKGKIKVQLSAEYTVACCKMCRYPISSGACSSGLASSTWIWIHKRGLVSGGGYGSKNGCQPVSFPKCNHSPDLSSALPFCNTVKTPSPKCHTRCTNENYGTNFFHDKHKFKKYYWLSTAVDRIQTEIMANGPVAAGIYIYSDLLNYKGGVYMVSATAHIVSYSMVKIIGWGEESGQPYWLITSTFGEQFGLKGLFKILRGRNEAIIEELVSATQPRGILNSLGEFVEEDDFENDNGVEENEEIELENEDDNIGDDNVSSEEDSRYHNFEE